MNLFKTFTISLLLLASSGFAVQAQNENPIAIQDAGAAISEQELAYLVSTWTSQMRTAALDDEGDRLELLNLMLANKRIAAEADKMVADDPELFYQYQHSLEGFKRDFVLRTYRDNLETPDFSALAEEQYMARRDKLALIPETRISSHILFMSQPGVDRSVYQELMTKAQGVLDELRAGADFNEMVQQYSEEPGAAARKGKFDRWIRYGDTAVAPPYSEGLFKIDNVGDYSELVQTQFGIHIIRLDGIQEKSYKSFAEVKEQIVTQLEKEYIKLAMKDLVTKFNFTDDVVIDDEVVTRVLAPYQPK